MLALQEELKEMIVENKLLKDKVLDLQERFKRIEEKREEFIKSLQDKIHHNEVEATKSEIR